MLILGEIADKYPTTIELWGFMLIPTLIVVGAGGWHRWIGLLYFILLLPACGWWAWGSYHEAYHESIAIHIQTELGTFWIVNSVASAFFPATTVGIILGIQWHIHLKKNKSLRLGAFA